MSISVAFLYAAVSISATLVATSAFLALCPDKCQCDGGHPSITLTVNCHGRPDVDAGHLTEQLDSLLSSNRTYGCLKSLNITNTPLTHVPRSVCRLTTLTRLYLDNNRLTRLPDNCLTNLTALEELTANGNEIADLQDGLLDGLLNLTALSLRDNAIKSIGLKVFNSSALLTSLTRVDLWSNRLTSLEPWPYFVGLNGRPDHRATIDVGNNYISNFTNVMGLQLECGMKLPIAEVNWQHNLIHHISDIFTGWKINLTTVFCLCPVTHDHSTCSFIFAHNQFSCDCIDFDIIKIVYPHQHMSLLASVYCWMQDELYRRRLNTIPLLDLVCELSERCPPGCQCVHRPANATLHVYCSNSSLTALPRELPALPKSYTKYKLDLSNNRLLRRLEHRDYFANSFLVDASNCGIEKVGNWKELLTVKHVYLHGNWLTSLPRSIIKLNVSTEDLSLHNNPWRCYCDERWMSDWVNSISDILSNPADVLCSRPQRLVNRNVPHISSDEFCIDPVTKALAIGMSSFAAVVVIVIFVGVVVYRLRVRLYTRWKFHPFDRDECLGEDMDYDVFLCSSSDDHDPHGLRILELLESKGYRVCYHERDFRAGAFITDNMVQAIVHSKRTVCLVSDSFLNSYYCMMEFDVAFHHNVALKHSKRLIVLMMLDSVNDLYANDASDTASLRHHLRQYTYIDYTADDWLDKLIYALPLRGLLHEGHNNVDDDQLLADIQPIAANGGEDIPIVNLM